MCDGCGQAFRTFRREFPATELSARSALEEFSAHCASANSDCDRGSSLIIALSEAVNNIVEHAAKGLGETQVCLTVRFLRQKIAIEICDNGGPFPAFLLTQNLMPTLAVDKDALPEGGFGWPLIHAIARDLHHTRIDNENRLSFSIPITNQAA